MDTSRSRTAPPPNTLTMSYTIHPLLHTDKPFSHLSRLHPQPLTHSASILWHLEMIIQPALTRNPSPISFSLWHICTHNFCSQSCPVLSPWLSQPSEQSPSPAGKERPGKLQQNANDVINLWTPGSEGEVALEGKDHVTLPLTHYICTIRHARRCPTKIGLCGNNKVSLFLYQYIMGTLIAALFWHKIFWLESSEGIHLDAQAWETSNNVEPKM